MSLKYALLGFLNYKSMTGYQLKQSFDQSIRNFWHASLSQIYPTLTQMKNDGLLTLEIKYQDSSPNAKVYHITDKGKTELQSWLNEPMEPQPFRNAFLIKIFFGANISKASTITQLKYRLKSAEDSLKKYQQIKNYLSKTHVSNNDDVLFESLTVDYGIKYMQAAISWCSDSIKKIESTEKEG